jgi:penicillin-binding protein 1C
MRRRLALAFALCAAIGGVWLVCEAFARAELVSPRATEIVYDRNGVFVTQISHNGDAGYGYWPLEKLPRRFVEATLALEDRRFYSHCGVDILAIARAAWNNIARRGRREGGSTIAMQVARMQNPGPRDFGRKIMEALTAVALIARHGHEAVLAQYLRLAPYGGGSHGVAHAAHLYFDKPVDDLSWAQTALLAAVPQAPGRMNLARIDAHRRA